MPDYYDARPEDVSRVFGKKLGDQLVGSDESKRSTKTFVPNQRMAGVLALLNNHYHRLAKKLIIMHEIETRPRDQSGRETGPGTVLSVEQAMELYPSIKSWKGFHDYATDHLASLEGFVTKAAVRADMLRENESRPMAAAMPERREEQKQGGGI